MAGRPIDLLLRIKADSTGVESGLSGLNKGLDNATTNVKELDKAIGKAGDKPITLSINQQAIAQAKARIKELQDQIAHTLSQDVTADVKPAQQEINKLRSAIKTLDKAGPEVTIDADTKPAIRSIDALKAKIAGLDLGALAGGANLPAGLGGIAGGLSAVGVAGAGAAAGAAAATLALGKMAADVETTKLQLKGLTGSAETAGRLFDQLREFANSTPFEFDQLAAATRILVAYGVAADDAVGVLKDLGEGAAATGADLESVARAYGQMVAKGKISNEELNQMNEAGIGGTRLLAQAMGKTTAEIQKMAENGELGADAIKLLGKEIGKTYSGSLTDQAKSFNGQLSNMQDALKTTGQNLGTLVLPGLKDMLTLVNAILGPLASLTQNLQGVADNDFFKMINESLNPMAKLEGIFSTLSGNADETGDSATKAADGLDKAADATTHLVKAASQVENLKDANKAIKDGFDKNAKAIDDANTAFGRWTQSIGQAGAPEDAYQKTLLGLKDSIKDNGHAFDDNGPKALANRDALREVASAAGAVIQSHRDQGASGTQLEKDMEGLRTDFVKTATSMGIPKKAAEELATKYGLVPSSVNTAITQSGMDKALADAAALELQMRNLNRKTTDIFYRLVPSTDSVPPMLRNPNAPAGQTAPVPSGFNASVSAANATMRATGSAAPGSASNPVSVPVTVQPNIRVYVNDDRFRDLIRVEVNGAQDALARRLFGRVRTL
jgi:tape measure domain-containing protein